MVMEAITKEQEDEIDASKKTFGHLRYYAKINKHTKLVEGKDIFLYGTVNLESKDDIKLLKKSPIANEDPWNLPRIMSNFNYNTGWAYADERGVFLYHDTYDKINWFKFNHLLLGKPTRVIIYKIPKAYVI